MIILAVDFGDSRTGVAVCDPTEFLASPVEVIHERYAPKVIERLCAIADEKKAELFVVGHPKNMNDNEGERAKKSEMFAKALAEASEIETMLWDERLTTVSARNALNNLNVRGKKRKAVIDSVAAVMILQSYIDYRRNSNV
ncbi:MAG: Holliday junction resolvase RuvX [Clostridiales bacterium]|jgi:putative Holliday junction resolvase|nr:Holliday junction resolvase RuvX [Clostridiales bacterium]